MSSGSDSHLLVSVSLEEYEKFNVLGDDFVTLVSDSHSCVCFAHGVQEIWISLTDDFVFFVFDSHSLESMSHEQRRKIDSPDTRLRHMFPCSTPCSVRQWIHVRTSVYVGV